MVSGCESLVESSGNTTSISLALPLQVQGNP
jgi:hypothetical protein